MAYGATVSVTNGVGALLRKNSTREIGELSVMVAVTSMEVSAYVIFGTELIPTIGGLKSRLPVAILTVSADGVADKVVIVACVSGS